MATRRCMPTTMPRPRLERERPTVASLASLPVSLRPHPVQAMSDPIPEAPERGVVSVVADNFEEVVTGEDKVRLGDGAGRRGTGALGRAMSRSAPVASPSAARVRCSRAAAARDAGSDYRTAEQTAAQRAVAAPYRSAPPPSRARGHPAAGSPLRVHNSNGTARAPPDRRRAPQAVLLYVYSDKCEFCKGTRSRAAGGGGGATEIEGGGARREGGGSAGMGGGGAEEAERLGTSPPLPR